MKLNLRCVRIAVSKFAVAWGRLQIASTIIAVTLLEILYTSGPIVIDEIPIYFSLYWCDIFIVWFETIESLNPYLIFRIALLSFQSELWSDQQSCSRLNHVRYPICYDVSEHDSIPPRLARTRRNWSDATLNHIFPRWHSVLCFVCLPKLASSQHNWQSEQESRLVIFSSKLE